MDSYVSLSLEDYNELYDKAKAYDEMQAEEAAENLKEFIKDIPGALNKLFGTKEESAATEQFVEEDDSEINVGDKVRLVEIKDGRFNAWFRVGDIVEVIEINNGLYTIQNKDNFYYACDESEIKKVNEGEEN